MFFIFSSSLVFWSFTFFFLVFSFNYLFSKDRFYIVQRTIVVFFLLHFLFIWSILIAYCCLFTSYFINIFIYYGASMFVAAYGVKLSLYFFSLKGYLFVCLFSLPLLQTWLSPVVFHFSLFFTISWLSLVIPGLVSVVRATGENMYYSSL